jgi:hypothetical protein
VRVETASSGDVVNVLAATGTGRSYERFASSVRPFIYGEPSLRVDRIPSATFRRAHRLRLSLGLGGI